MPEADETNPWQTLSSEVRYDNAWITVSHRDVINPSGGPGIYGLVHYKNLAIGILPVDDEGNTWLVGQYRYPTNHYSWEIGIEASTWRELLHLELSNSVSDELAYVYRATGLTFGAASPEETEQLTLKKLPLTEAIAMALDGRIVDALSVAALLRAKVEFDAGTLYS